MKTPKLEFFRFDLVHKSGDRKVFRDFVLENGFVPSARCKDKTFFAHLYAKFMDELNTDYAKNDSLRKVMTVFRGKINEHCDKKPTIRPGNIICGVVHGGGFGIPRVVANINDKKDVSNIKKDQPVLQYYYLFFYFPLDHHEGFFMVHSDSQEDTITKLVRAYVASFFQRGDYKKPTIKLFVPKHFQNEFKDGAELSNLAFKTTYVDSQIEDNDPLKEFIEEYDVRISISPKRQKPSLNVVPDIIRRFGNFLVGRTNFNKSLSEYEKCTVNAKNSQTNSTKMFEWNPESMELNPVVKLNGRVAITDDGQVDFSELDNFCNELFNNNIKRELRPDLYV